MIAYKGFTKELQGKNGFQFTVGEMYQTGKAIPRTCGTQITIIKEITLLELIKLHLRKGVCQNGLLREI